MLPWWRHYLNSKKPVKILQVAKRLLKAIPRSRADACIAGWLALKKGKPSEAKSLLWPRGPCQIPLDDRLRQALGTAHAALAFEHAAAGPLRQGPGEFSVSVSHVWGSYRLAILCKLGWRRIPGRE